MYPRLNKDEWLSPLLYNLDSVVGGGAQGQRKINITYSVFSQKKQDKTKRNLPESDSENEEADFTRYIFIESLVKDSAVNHFNNYTTRTPPCLLMWTAKDR